MGGRKVGRGERDRGEGEGGGGSWECNWTLDNTFLESFTSSASPEGECRRLFSVLKSCFDPNLMHFCPLTVSVFITLKLLSLIMISHRRTCFYVDIGSNIVWLSL